MAIFRRKKNKKFSYTPRYFEHEGEGSPFKPEHKFDKYRSTLETNKSLKNKFKSAWSELRQSRGKKSNQTLLIIVALLVLLFLYIIDFDLSIFTLKP